ncbi:MAG: ABC transporter permease [Dehalococcoidia bacterium]|nr:ABC transporter permease [Dehalococcoidia bacterium]
MWAYIIRRLIAVPFMLFGLSALLFWLLYLRPGNAALTNFGLVSPDQTKDAVANLEKDLGLDRPAVVQYFDWAGHALTGDLGESLKNRRSISGQIGERLPNTVEIAVLTILITAAIGIPVGILSAIRPGSWLDYSLRVVTIAGISIPSFWVATLLLILPVIWWGWTPLHQNYVNFTTDPLENLRIVIWPALVLAVSSAAYVARIVRSSMLETLYSDYVRTARAKGLRERVVIIQHVFRSSLVTLLTVIGLQFGAVLGGSVIAEQIFAIPGIGLLTYQAVFNVDYTLVLGVTMVFALMFVLINLAVDILYTFVDPRIRY